MSETRSGRFSIIPAVAVDDKRFDKHPKTKTVLEALGTYSNREGWCWPSQNTLAERLGCSRQAISQHIGLLVNWGYVEKRSRKRPNGSTTSNAYRILFDIEVNPTFLRVYSEEEDEPAAPPKPPEEDHLPINVLDMATVLAKVCKLDENLNKGMLFKNASDLIKAGYSVGDVLQIYSEDGPWYTQDFRGQKGEAPTIGLIRSTIAVFMNKQEEAPTTEINEGWFNG